MDIRQVLINNLRQGHPGCINITPQVLVSPSPYASKDEWERYKEVKKTFLNELKKDSKEKEKLPG